LLHQCSLSRVDGALVEASPTGLCRNGLHLLQRKLNIQALLVTCYLGGIGASLILMTTRIVIAALAAASVLMVVTLLRRGNAGVAVAMVAAGFLRCDRAARAAGVIRESQVHRRR
jgi:hypothetical protein